MGFKSVEDFNDERYRDLFRLPNNGDQADVIFLYQAKRDMLVTDVHYIRSPEYSGYIHCLKNGCPACAKNIPVRNNKLFIPLYNLTSGKIEFWDRTINFEAQMSREVFNSYPNPSEFVFRITRQGEARDINTTYTITAVAKNTVMTYDQLLAKFNAKMPDYYENICRSVTAFDLSRMLSTGAEQNLDEYVPTPRAGYSAIPTAYVDVSANGLVSDNTPEDTSFANDDTESAPFPTTSDSNDEAGSEDIPDPIF